MADKDSSIVKEKTWFQRLKSSKGYDILATFIKSAAVGLLFAAICFVYDIYHDKQQDRQLEESIGRLANIEESVVQLEEIKQSLSTRYLGIFPTYISQISTLFENLVPSDSVVIFEDVLYYGIKSRPDDFYNLNVQLFEHALKNGSITVAYYDSRISSTKPIMDDLFHKMIIESRIGTKYQASFFTERSQKIDSLSNIRMLNLTLSRQVDSVLCEKYFAATRNDDIAKFESDVVAYLSDKLIDHDTANLSEAERITYEMCVKIDSVKKHHLGDKPLESILFSDYEQMYRNMSEIIVSYYNKYHFDLVPLDEYLTMSCWMVQRGGHKGVKTVLAFPSKYSSDEIGFYSQDEAFSKYIGTMLDGVRQSRRLHHD